MDTGYKQTTHETCLVCCLMDSISKLIPIEINRELELDMIDYVIRFSRIDFCSGHLDYVCRNFNLKITRLVDSQEFLGFINKIKVSKSILNKFRKIDLETIDFILRTNSPIVYVDAECLFKGCPHAPHFIKVLSKTKDGYMVYDPWDGKIKEINKITLLQGILSLKNRLKICPQILIVGIP